jgi:hypothetical protein
MPVRIAHHPAELGDMYISGKLSAGKTYLPIILNAYLNVYRLRFGRPRTGLER